MSKKFDDMSSQELYELAQARAAEEAERDNQERIAMIDKLKQDRRQMIKEHKKAVAVIEREIDKLRGRSSKSSRSSEGGHSGESPGSNEILEIIREHGAISTADLRGVIEDRGYSTKNLGQNLTYLKRTQRVINPSRAVYEVAPGN
jgi:hypothetical protein